MEEHKAVNAQANQRIDTVESTLDEIKSHLISVHFSDLFLSKKTDLYAEIWNN